MTEEVLRTVLVEIEGILNSKPLGYTSTDIAEHDPVTPNMLHMGRPDASLPQVIYPESELLSKRRWRHSRLLADHFWRRFLRNHLPEFQVRQKWLKEAENLQPGTVVMIVDHQLPRALWPVGQVTKVFPGEDGRTRAAKWKSKGKSIYVPSHVSSASQLYWTEYPLVLSLTWYTFFCFTHLHRKCGSGC